MNVILYRLRDAGRPLSYAEVKARPRPQGRLVFGRKANPEEFAQLLGDGDNTNAPAIDHARVRRISNGCVLIEGFTPGVTSPLKRQTWLCAVDERAGEAALRKIRPPAASDHPLGPWVDELAD